MAWSWPPWRSCPPWGSCCKTLVGSLPLHLLQRARAPALWLPAAASTPARACSGLRLAHSLQHRCALGHTITCVPDDQPNARVQGHSQPTHPPRLPSRSRSQTLTPTCSHRSRPSAPWCLGATGWPRPRERRQPALPNLGLPQPAHPPQGPCRAQPPQRQLPPSRRGAR